MGTRPDTAKGRAFEVITAVIAARYAALGSCSGSEPRLLGCFTAEWDDLGDMVCSTSNSERLCVRGTGRSGYRLGEGEDKLDIVERDIGGGWADTCRIAAGGEDKG